MIQDAIRYDQYVYTGQSDTANVAGHFWNSVNVSLPVSGDHAGDFTLQSRYIQLGQRENILVNLPMLLGEQHEDMPIGAKYVLDIKSSAHTDTSYDFLRLVHEKNAEGVLVTASLYKRDTEGL